MAIGLTLPLARATGSLGYLEVTRSELAAVEQNLRSLLYTNWGERVMHFNLGCNLIEFLFEQQSSDLKERIEDRIRSQVATWMPFVIIDNITVLFPSDSLTVPDNVTRLSLRFRLSSRPDLSSVLNADLRSV